ncbi:MAG: hypothetical protein JXX14_18445 [Deltaproteobacteria bacterium]|nr:hypothetical protein [Deltaproteobacteria bacterium]
MNTEITKSEAGQRYAIAYEAHHTTMDLHEALALYRTIATEHPNSKEARDAHQQIQNIEKLLIPRQAQLDRQTELVGFYFAQTKSLSERLLSN